MRLKIRIASRTSDLARVQAITVGNLLKAHSDVPNLEVDYIFKKSLGDINQDDPLWKMPEKGVFTEDFKADLLKGETDMVVHSWKDLPVEDPQGSEIVATLPRADLRDILLFKSTSVSKLINGTLNAVKILSSSPRRAYNLTPFLKDHLPSAVPPEINFLPVRGNIPTRLRKLIEGEMDGLIVAKAALDRLLETNQEEWVGIRKEIRSVLNQVNWMVLPISANPPAAAQGAIAIEIRSDRDDLRSLLKKIHCEATFSSVVEERKVLKSYGGGCHQKIGIAVLQRPYGKVVSLKGETDQGIILSKYELETPDEIAPTTIENIWPATEEDQLHAFFRRDLKVKNPNTDLWVSKENALPLDWKVSQDQRVWVSGLTTWRKLAVRGIWVNGSSEGLGETEDPRIRAVLGREPKFTKLGHAEGVKGSMPMLATYVLEAQTLEIGLLKQIEKKTHFYWMSGSLFLYCLDRVPAILNANHSCGPGNTAAVIEAKLGADHKPHLFTGIEEWRMKVLKK